MDYITVPKVENVTLLDHFVGKTLSNGSLYITATHLIYVEASGAAQRETWIAMHHIASVERLPTTSKGCPLILRCKNFLVADFILDSDTVCQEVYVSLLKLSQTALPEDQYAFFYNPKSTKEMRENGWKLIDPLSDFGRMGIPNRYWTVTDANKNYEASICRCSQPLCGFYTRSGEDERLLEAIGQTNPGSRFMYIIDTRPKAVKVEKASVLVHCSDGWDRTAQVCSLASILLDPFYRTFKGLMILIEKEWISMGHKFSQRCGHLDGDSKEVSPVFTQFLDCIWQLMEQFPSAFEFNEIFLLEIHDHVFSCQFGNFLGNCQKDRDNLRVYEKTHCVWPFLAQRKPDFKNPLYKGLNMYGVLSPSTVPCSIQFWCGMYNRFDKGLHPQQSMLACLLEIKKQKMLQKLKAHEDPPEELFTSIECGDLLSQHPESPLTSPLGFMGDRHDLSREGGLQAQKDQVKSQCGDCYHDFYDITGSLMSLSISGDAGFSGDPGTSEARGASEATGLSKASTEEAGSSKQ